MKSAYLLLVRRFKRACRVIKHNQIKLLNNPISSKPRVNFSNCHNRRFQQNKQQYLTWLKASVGEDIHLIAVDDVAYFKAEDKYVSIFKKGQGGLLEEFILRVSLKELLAQLNPDEFWQIHRSVVVKASAIDKVKKDYPARCRRMYPVRSCQSAVPRKLCLKV